LKTVFITLVLSLVVGTTSCSRSKNPLAGKWKSSKGAVVEFRRDGTCTIGTGKYPAPGKYTVISNTVMIQLDGDLTKAFGAAEWQVAITNDVLYITAPDVLGRPELIPFNRMK